MVILDEHMHHLLSLKKASPEDRKYLLAVFKVSKGATAFKNLSSETEVFSVSDFNNNLLDVFYVSTMLNFNIPAQRQFVQKSWHFNTKRI